MKFKTKIIQIGNNTGINVPDEIIIAFGAGKKPPVKITLNNYTYQGTVAVMGGLYMVSLSADNRKKANVNGGDELDIIIELDTEKRVVELPEDFSIALNKNKTAKQNFELLSNSKKKSIVIPIMEAKTASTRTSRISKAIETLNA